MTEITAGHREDVELDKEIVILILIVPLDLHVEEEIADSFIRWLPAIWIAATRSQVLGLAVTLVIAREENAGRDRATVIITLTVGLDSCVEKTTANSFILTLNGTMIVAIESQVLVEIKIGFIARHPEDVQRDKETATVTVPVNLVLSVVVITVKNLIHRP